MSGRNDHYTFLQHLPQHDVVNIQTPNRTIAPFPSDPYGSHALLHGSILQLLDYIQPSGGYHPSACGKGPALPEPLGPPPSHLKPINKSPTDKERDDMLRYCELRAERPYLKRDQEVEKRFPCYLNACLDMLVDGHHTAFTTFFEINRREEQEREEASPTAHYWMKTPIAGQPEKIQRLQVGLYAAEDARRAFDPLGIFEAYESLASYFEDHPDDRWLMDYFLMLCLDISVDLEESDKRNELEAIIRLRIGESKYKAGDLKGAGHFLRQCEKLCRQSEYQYRDKNLLNYVCELLTRILWTLSEAEDLSEDDKKLLFEEIVYFALDSNNDELLYDAKHRLGMYYLDLSMIPKSLELLVDCYTFHKKKVETVKQARACHALAKAFEMQKDLERCVHFFNEFLYITQLNGHLAKYNEALTEFGCLLHRLGYFAEAQNYFLQGYKQSCELGNQELAKRNMMMMGVSSASRFTHLFQKYVFANTTPTIRVLADWKSQGGNAKNVFTKKGCQIPPQRFFKPDNERR